MRQGPISPWYQFSLRSLLLLTLFVAVLCSIGVYTHWLFAAAIAMLALAGVSGRIVSGTPLGYLEGVVDGFQVSILVGFGCIFLPFLWEPWRLCVVFTIAALIGGVLGGYAIGHRERLWESVKAKLREK